jgi:hypothetical protein
LRCKGLGFRVWVDNGHEETKLYVGQVKIPTL